MKKLTAKQVERKLKSFQAKPPPKRDRRKLHILWVRGNSIGVNGGRSLVFCGRWVDPDVIVRVDQRERATCQNCARVFR